MIVNIPLVLGMYPVTAVGSALKSAMILSVVAVPVALAVTTVAQAADEIADVPRAAVPFAIVCVIPVILTAPVCGVPPSIATLDTGAPGIQVATFVPKM